MSGFGVNQACRSRHEPGGTMEGMKGSVSSAIIEARDYEHFQWEGLFMTKLKTRKKKSQRSKTQNPDGTMAPTFDYSRLSSSFLKLPKPAQRALINHKIYGEKDLARWTRTDVATLHGIGPSAFPILENALSTAGLKFKR